MSSQGFEGEGFESVRFWLARLGRGTAVTYGYAFADWVEWMRVHGGRFSAWSPDAMVAYQRDVGRAEAKDLLRYVEAFVSGMRGAHQSKKNYMTTIRSFFLHNDAELPADRSFKIRGDKPRTMGSLSVEDLRAMVMSCNRLYRAVFLCMFQGGMGEAEFDYWNRHGWGSLRDGLRREQRVIRCDLPGRKMDLNETPFYTLIGGDAVDAIREWLPERVDGDYIFTNRGGGPVTVVALYAYWLRHLKELGLVKPPKSPGNGTRYGKHVHELRDVFATQWEKSPAKMSVSEFMMGHVRRIDPNEYRKAYRDERWVLEEHRKALPYLQIMSSGRPYGYVEQDEMNRAIDELREDMEAKFRAMIEVRQR